MTISIKGKLNRLKKHVVRKEELELPKPDVKTALSATQSIPFLQDWERAGAKPYYFEEQFCLVREVRYPLSHLHGHYPFSDLLRAVELWQSFSGNHPLSAKGLSPTNLFFFDTETTGLNGGAGNTIFLLGHAQLVDDEIVLKQHFLPEPGYEVALYKSFLESVDYTTLVTYNGKAFDWPQVQTQHTLVKEHVPKLPAFGHFDLYHASRRLWKERIESVKLANVEGEILGIKRENDIPGFLAPMIYFDFVERKDPEAILKVLQHNEVDILSLITLFIHLTIQILSEDPQQSATEKTLVGKWFQYLGEKEVAATSFISAAKEGDVVAKHYLAFHRKREKKFDEAKNLWMEVSGQPILTIQKEACIELAKLMEHQYKDYSQAVFFTEKALAIHTDSNRSDQGDTFAVQAKKRLYRLFRKLNT